MTPTTDMHFRKFYMVNAIFIDRKAVDLREKITRQLAEFENAMAAEGGSVPYNPYDLLRECLAYLTERLGFPNSSDSGAN